MRFHLRIFPLILLGALATLPQTLSAAPGQTPAWKLRVALDGAAVRLEPDLKSPVMTTVAKGTTLVSAEAVGAWFRVIVPPGKDGTTIIGFIASNEVEILEEKTTPEPDFWAPEPGGFQGLGFDLLVEAGLTYLGSGDLNAGIRGMYDEMVAFVESYGYSVQDKDVRPLRLGVQTKAEILRWIDPRLGLGIGGEYVYARRLDTFGYVTTGGYRSANSVSTLKTLILGPKIHYSIPLSRFIAVRLNGGPAVFVTAFKHTQDILLSPLEKSLLQKASKTVLGARGGAALDIKLNNRTAFFLQAEGHYAKSSSLTGWERDFVMWMGIDMSGPEMNGPLYFLPGGPFPRLGIRPETPGGDARNARLDLSGVGLACGLKFKF